MTNKTIADESELTMDSILWKAVYASHKLTKSKLETVCLSEIIEQCKKKELSLMNAAIILLALSKITRRKTRHILEECTRFLVAVNGQLRAKETRQKRKVEAGVNSSVMKEDVFQKTSLHLQQESEQFNFNSGGFDLDIPSHLEPELVRNNTSDIMNISNPNLTKNTSSAFERVKKPREIEDKVIELNIEAMHKKLLKKSTEIDLLKESKCVLEHVGPALFVNEIVLNAIKTEIDAYNAEVIRNSTTLHETGLGQFEDVHQADFDFANGHVASDDPNRPLLNLHEIGDEFVFHEAMATLPREEQARLFVGLLAALTASTHSATQNSPFGDIFVEKIE